jgi:hypothetical protein
LESRVLTLPTQLSESAFISAIYKIPDITHPYYVVINASTPYPVAVICAF